MIEVRIHSLSIDAVSNQPVIILKADGEERMLPIWIGHSEATAILLALQGVEPPRPLTHDLMVNLLTTLGFAVTAVRITRLDEGTFFATIGVRGKNGEVEIDARPSDSIALAVRVGVPISVAEEVMDEAALVPEPEAEEGAGEGAEEGRDHETELRRFREFLENVNPGDFQG